MTRHERQRTNSATSYHSPNSSRYGSEISMPAASQGSRNPIQVPARPRKFEREQNISPGSFAPASSPPLSSPNAASSIMNLSDHRRELAVLQTPPFILRQNPPSAGNSPAIPPNGQSVSAITPTVGFLNSNIFDSQEISSPHRPGTAPSAGSQGPPDNYFPDERRPSVASSTGSKSSIGKKSIYKRIFGGDGDTDSPGSSESSLPQSTTPRTHYGFPRPATPTISSRPRTPLPSSEVVPFLYQDPGDIRRLGDAPVHDAPVIDQQRYQAEETPTTSSSHSHRINLHRKNKELPHRPSSSGKDSLSLSNNDYSGGLRLRFDGPASSHSSQTRLVRPCSPTPSCASSLSNNPPRSPGDNTQKKHSHSVWSKLGGLVRNKEKAMEHDKEISPSTKSKRPRDKFAEPLHVSVAGVSPVNPTPKRGNANEFVNPRAFDYAPVDQMLARKQNSGRGGHDTYGRMKGGRRGVSYETYDGKRGLSLAPNRSGRIKPMEEGVSFELDTDFSNLGDIVRLPGPLAATPPGPNTSWLLSEETPPLGTDITWEPPESWDSRNPKTTPLQGASDEGDDDEDAQYCIRIFRADSTFATLSCKLQSSVTEVLTLLGRKSFLQGGLSNYQIVLKKNDLLRILGPNDKPLKIQKRLLEQAGYMEDDHLDEIGREDHSYLCRFTFMMARMGGYSLDQDTGLGKLQKYIHVDLQGRNLLTIPITLYHKATEIISLNLSRNLALNIPKDFIQQCVNLRKIEFQGNEAEKLPPSISAASRLTYLDISNNRLEELEHAQLDNHVSLVALKMANNRLRSLPDSFSNFKSLRVLNISSNDLIVFPSFICELVTLVDLDISFNMVRTLPLEIGQLSALERLTATNNRLSGALPPTFSMLGSLKELDIRYNNLTNIDVVAELPRLELVVAGHNTISGFFKDSFPKFRALHLNSNPVTRFYLPNPMPTLKLLNLSNAKIAAIAETLFERMPNLEKLILDRNHIVSFPPQIGKLKKLEHLSCYNNELASLPKEIGQLTELRYLDLHYNNLKTLPGEIWQMTGLMHLNLSSNILKEFPKPIVNPSTPSTSQENSSTSAIQREDDTGKFGDPTESRRPSQASSGFLSVGGSPGGSGRKASLVSTHSSGGRKPSIISKAGSENSTVAPSSCVRKDSATSSRIQNSFAMSLKYLHLADNRLADEVFEEISLLCELRVLNLSYNDLYDIPSRALSRMPNLNELYLSGNELTSLPTEDLEHIQHLKVLHINGNKFQTLPAELGKVKKLLALDVGSNSLKYNISNWPYDWNWNWNLDLKYLNLSGNKRLEIKPNRSDPNSGRERSMTDFSQLSKLRVLGLMDVTLSISPNVPDQTEDRRVRLSGSMVRSMSYGMADFLGRSDHLSMIDLVIPTFRGNNNECIIGMFDGQSLSTGGSKVSLYLQESLEFFLKEELVKLRSDEGPGKALHRAFLNLNKELATTAMQTLDEKNVAGVNPHRGSTTLSAMLGPDDLSTGSSATVVYMSGPHLYVANVGDAMALLVNTNGDYKVLTKKHDPAIPPELGRIRDAGGFVSRNGKLNDVLDVSRAFGYFHLMPCVNAAPHVTDTLISDQEELLIIASKELWEYISYQSAVDIARTERRDLMRAAHKLRDFAIAYGSTSKIMVMILGIGDFKKTKNRKRTQSVCLAPGQVPPADDGLFPVKLRRNPRREMPDNSALARLDAEVKAPEGDLAMVFTDIKNSTLLWETYPVAMRAAIKVHNNIMRRQLRIVGGYEIKTEGDAFMVCFPTATSALLWCFSVQAILLDAAWPSEILDCEHGKEIRDNDSNRIYRGLSVRMGIHWGAPVCETDPITRRMDYFGPIVNRAARISAEADGGQITVSSDFLAEINRCVKAYQNAENSDIPPEDIFGDELAGVAQAIARELRTLTSQGFEVKELGERKLKGLENPEFIYLMYPSTLAGRLTTTRGVPKANPIKTALDPEQVWALWEVSLRLEMLCSAVNTSDVPMLRPYSQDLATCLRRSGDGFSDLVLMSLLDHIVTRIENCVANLYVRKLVAPDPSANLFESGSPLWDLIAGLQAKVGAQLPQRTSPPPQLQAMVETQLPQRTSPPLQVLEIASSSSPNIS